MSDTMDICGLKAERGQKLQTYIPVLDSNTKIQKYLSLSSTVKMMVLLF